jgi:hypothetical protein
MPRNLELKISVIDAVTKAPIVGQSLITFYQFRNLYIEYFNEVSISGIQFSPAVDWNFMKSGLTNKPNQDLKPFRN